MLLSTLLAEEARLSQVLVSEQARQKILERRARELAEHIFSIDRIISVSRENLRTLKSAPVVKLDRFKETRDHLIAYADIRLKRAQEAFETHDQIDDNTAKLAQLDEQLCENLAGQAEFGQLFHIADYR
jgi:hypothetical protein